MLFRLKLFFRQYYQISNDYLSINRACLILLFVTFLFSCHNKQSLSQLETILQKGELTVVTRNSPTTYYEAADGYAGFEFELAQEFADYLGVTVKFVVEDSIHMHMLC